jgi:hypothetical protein
MALSLNLIGNARFAAPGGYPVTLWRGGETVVEGITPKGTETVVAVVKAVALVEAGGGGDDPDDNASAGTADVHLALFATPTSSGGSDGAEVEDTRVSASGLTSAGTTLTLTVPTTADGTAPATYIARLWVMQLQGTRGVELSSFGVT